MKKLILFLPLLICAISPSAQIGTIESFSKISATEGNFTGSLDNNDSFSVCEVIGDLNGDGFEDMAVGARYDDDGGYNRGAVWILFLNGERSVISYQKISDLEGGFTGVLDDEDNFGYSISALGDVNNDDVLDIAVGAWADDDGGINSGAVWILFLSENGTVGSHQKISSTQGGIIGLTQNRLFGISVCAIGDLNNDGVPDIAVGAPNYDNDGGQYRGCIWILFLNINGTVLDQQLINSNNGGFSYYLEDGDKFGYGLSNLGDVNNDGVTDIAVSANYDDDGGSDTGAVFILFLNTDGTVSYDQKISDIEGGFNGGLNQGDRFGYSTSGIGDINNDGVNDIAVSVIGDDDGGDHSGAVWIIMLNIDGTMNNSQKISATAGGLTGIDSEDSFGAAISRFQTGEKELIVGAFNDDDGGENKGAIWTLGLQGEDTSVAEEAIDRITWDVYPNPSNGILSIRLDGDIQFKEFEAILYDNSGSVMMEEYNISQDKITIDLSNCDSGLYYLKLDIFGMNCEMKKIVVM